MTKQLLRQALAGLAVLLLAGCGQQKPALPAATEQPAQIFFATDLHYLSQSLTDNGPDFQERMAYGDGKTVQYCEAITETLVEQVLAAQPDALVLGGDLSFNGEKQSHIDLAAKLRRIQQGGVPVLLLPGNHDIDVFQAGSFIDGQFTTVESVDRKGFYQIYKEFGYQDAITRDKDSFSYLYPLRSDLWVLVLDVDGAREYNTVSDSTMAWLEKWLAQARQQGIGVVSATHHNLLVHNELFTSGFMVKNADQVVTLLDRYGVLVNLTGHIHIQHSMERAQGMGEVVTTALVVTPNQYGVVDYDGQTARYSTQELDVAAWARATGQTDPNLLAFGAFSQQFFWKIAHRQVMDVQTGDGVEEGVARQLAAYFADVNTQYFQGKPITRGRDDPAYLLWQRYCKGERTPIYIDTMLQSNGRDQRQGVFTRTAPTPGP